MGVCGRNNHPHTPFVHVRMHKSCYQYLPCLFFDWCLQFERNSSRTERGTFESYVRAISVDFSGDSRIDFTSVLTFGMIFL